MGDGFDLRMNGSTSKLWGSWIPSNNIVDSHLTWVGYTYSVDFLYTQDVTVHTTLFWVGGRRIYQAVKNQFSFENEFFFPDEGQVSFHLTLRVTNPK